MTTPRFVACAIVLATLGACGVDGAPSAPQEEKVEPGITISGDARAGVVKGF